MSSISRPFIDELLARTDLVGLINSRLPLKKKGNQHWACCPFHQERTPSFTVKENFFKCFGCDKHGNAIDFLMDFDHLTFPEAVERLAEYNGMAVVYEQGGDYVAKKQTAEYDQGLQLLARAAELFHHWLTDSQEAQHYLHQRRLNPAAVNHFQLGYAPRGNRLMQTLQGEFPIDLFKKTGLIGQGEDGQIYDWFRHRLIFPIRNLKGQVIAFGGRALDGQQRAKYLNSPESNWFSKRLELYALNSALAQRPKALIVVEGYMDVVKMWQFGIKNAVAALGTAFGDGHWQLLRRRCDSFYFCFDGDQAGRKAAARALEVLFTHHEDRKNPRFVFMVPGEDPDSFLEKYGLDALRQLFIKGLPPSQFLWQLLDDGRGAQRSVEDKSQLLSQLRQWLEKIPASAGHYRSLLWQDSLRHFDLQALPEPAPDSPGDPPAASPPMARSELAPPAAAPVSAHKPKGLEDKFMAVLALEPSLADGLRPSHYAPDYLAQMPNFWLMVSALQNSEDPAATVAYYQHAHQLDLTGDRALLPSAAELEKSLRRQERFHKKV